MSIDIPAMIRQLSSDNGSRRREAALALGASGDREAAKVVVERLSFEQDPHVLEDLTWATVALIEFTEPAVLAMLQSDDPKVRMRGAHVVSKVGAPGHFEQVLPLAYDADADVAIKAYRAVTSTGGKRALAPLIGLLGVGDALQRDALTASLSRFGEDAAVKLADALSHEKFQVRVHAADALGYLGPEAAVAVDALAQATRDEDFEVRLIAASALGQIGEPARPALEALADSGDEALAAIARRALHGLAEIESRAERHDRLRKKSE